MSWDIVIFNSPDKVDDLEEINTDELISIDFNSVFEKHFKQIKKDDLHREIIGQDFTIDYFVDNEPSTNFMMSLYGEKAIYELIYLAKQNGWQIFDTGNGEILDLDDPSTNGYSGFQNYLKNILDK